MGEKGVKVFGVWASPFSVRVEIALKMKGVDYEFIAEDLQKKSDLLLQYNPIHKKVPVFLHDGKPIVESLLILEYIDETWKQNPILPLHPFERAKARFWAKFIDDQCLLAMKKTYWGDVNERANSKEEFKEHMKTLENELKGKRFFGGDTIGFVDIVAKVICYWVLTFQKVTGIEVFSREECPILFNWMDEVLSCDVIRENLPPKDKLMKFYSDRFGATKG